MTRSTYCRHFHDCAAAVDCAVDCAAAAAVAVGTVGTDGVAVVPEHQPTCQHPLIHFLQGSLTATRKVDPRRSHPHASEMPVAVLPVVQPQRRGGIPADHSPKPQQVWKPLESWAVAGTVSKTPIMAASVGFDAGGDYCW